MSIFEDGYRLPGSEQLPPTNWIANFDHKICDSDPLPSQKPLPQLGQRGQMSQLWLKLPAQTWFRKSSKGLARLGNTVCICYKVRPLTCYVSWFRYFTPMKTWKRPRSTPFILSHYSYIILYVINPSWPYTIVNQSCYIIWYYSYIINNISLKVHH